MKYDAYATLVAELLRTMLVKGIGKRAHARFPAAATEKDTRHEWNNHAEHPVTHSLSRPEP